MENKKPVLITIVVLLLIFTPLTIIGLLFRDDRHPLEENPTHDFFYKGYLWFYDKNDEFLSKYECMTNICDYTTGIINDDTYSMKYYKEGNSPKMTLLDDKYTFLTDGSVIYLYDAQSGSALQTYKALKNYSTNINGDYYIIQNTDDLWGVLMVNEMLASVLPFEYDFIGLPNRILTENTLASDKFIVKKDNKWFIVNNKNNVISGYIDNPIIEITEDYIFSKDENKVRVYSYNNFEYLTAFQIKDYILIDGYVGIITDNFVLVYKHLGENYIKSVTIPNKDAQVTFERKDNNLNVLMDGNVVETIAVS